MFKPRPEKFNYKCYIVAGGPSLQGFDWSRLHGKFIIAINRSYEVLPNAQVVYFTDEDFWRRHQRKLLKHRGMLFRGILPSHSKPKHPNVNHYHLTGQSGLEKTEGKLRHGSNSTYAALNLAAVHFGFKAIYLLGVDMKWDHSAPTRKTHWHDGHSRIDPETAFQKMIRSYQSIVKPLSDMGIQVYNTNPDSALDAFPKITIDEALK